MERATDSADHSRAASMTHDVAIRDSAPRSLEHPSGRHPSVPVTAASSERLSNDVWTSAISRLQAQVSYNTGMLESHRRQLTDIETAVTRLHSEMNHVVAAFHDVRAEMRAQPPAAERPRNDPGDLEVFAGQLQRLTNRVNEIDGITMQMDLMKNRMKRLEGGSSTTPVPSASAPHAHPERPAAPSSAYRDAPMYDAKPQPPQPPQPPSQPVPPPPHHPAAQHPPLPPMRTTSVPSSDVTRPSSFPPQAADVQNSNQYRPSSESRPFSSEAAASQPPASSGYRPAEALPPPSALSGWRPAEPYPPGASPHASMVAPGFRPQAMEPETHGAPTSGWAAVNANQAIKRPPEETRSPYESPLMDGSKRPKLAPLMPNMARTGYSEEAYGPPQSSFQSGAVTSNPSEASVHPRSRAPSDGSQPLSHPAHTPAQQALQHNFRFITSTQHVEPQDAWRSEGDRPLQPTEHGHGHGPRGGRGGRGRGRGGRGRGGRGRGGGAHAHHGHHAHAGGNGGLPGQSGDSQEQSTPEWEKPEWTGVSHGSPNGHCHPDPARGGSFARRGDSHAGFVGVDRSLDYPATPVQHSAGPYDPYAQGSLESSQMSSGKKTRTKPIRNAEGILIRKDGRPDMRSVSSANNLRKVHAKKEAERAGLDGKTAQHPLSLNQLSHHFHRRRRRHSLRHANKCSSRRTRSLRRANRRSRTPPRTHGPNVSSGNRKRWQNGRAIFPQTRRRGVDEERRERKGQQRGKREPNQPVQRRGDERGERGASRGTSCGRRAAEHR